MSTRAPAECRDIETYVAELDLNLRGPRRVKRSLLVEARDGLVDAAAAYERAGLDGPAAQQRAIADFGAAAEVAPDYQAELGFAQSRRTAGSIIGVIGLQIVAWDHAWPLLPEPPPAPADSPIHAFDTVVESLGSVLFFAAVALVLGARLGARRPRLGVHAARVTGVLGWVVGGYLIVSAVLLSVLGPTSEQTPIGLVVALLVAIVGLPVVGLLRSSRRCLAVA